MFSINLLFTWFFILATALFPKPVTTGKEASVHSKSPIKWAVEKTSVLRVSGKSNVNEFSCDVTSYGGADTITCTDDGSTDQPVRLTGCLQIDVFRFDCHNRMLTGDLRKTLKAEEYPQLTIRFLTLDHTPFAQNNTQCMKGWVEVALAGVRKPFQISYEFVKDGPSSYLLNGKKTFCFSDFKLTPPRKLGGVIQVKDEFNVQFQLKLNAIN